MLTKIATCCYCGTRTLLELRGRARHELACASCGAPLRYLKMLPSAPVRTAAHGPAPVRRAAFAPQPKRSGKPKRKNLFSGLGRKLWDELRDEVEDLLD